VPRDGLVRQRYNMFLISWGKVRGVFSVAGGTSADGEQQEDFFAGSPASFSTGARRDPVEGKLARRAGLLALSLPAGAWRRGGTRVLEPAVLLAEIGAPGGPVPGLARWMTGRAAARPLGKTAELAAA